MNASFQQCFFVDKTSWLATLEEKMLVSHVCLEGKRGFQVGCCVSDFVWLDCLARLFQRCGHLEV